MFLLLTGGEPALRPDFPEIYTGLKQMGLLVSINSNGYLLQGELLEQIIANPPHRVNITLYGVSNDTYASLCGIPAYDTVLKNIQTLREANIDVKLNLTMTPENQEQREQIRAKAKELGAHIQTATYLFPPVRITGCSAFPQRMSPEEAGRMEAERLQTSLSDERFRQFLQTLRAEEDAQSECTHCRAGRSSFWLSWDGKLMPCGMMPYPAADVLETGFRSAWQQVRDQVKTIQYPEKCRRCGKRDLCHICMAKCYTETLGFEEAPEYCCRMTEALVQELQSFQNA